ncbi:MAG: enoyl-CoA hydratase/isomerase family protein [Dehalococcoidia bacterium]|nr:enoyl-CoA hydratase [Chloroflexi bacterium CFX7]MCK6565387.1 enoyl-CoA hydratase-related protein [Dehalococcoidia bacterium]NUQ56292.1 enoyl-CoA hydratase/isomerase family protein [Dehalococcoidia bacterium]
MTGTVVKVETAGGVATVTLNSPENRNALSRVLVSGLREALDAVLADAAVRVIVLTGAGPVFCAGADLKEQLAANESGEPGKANEVPAVLSAIWHSPKPVVCRVNGSARAGGLGVLAACDIVIGVEGATFGASEVRIGLAPAVITTTILPRTGAAAAMPFFLTGEPISAAEALRIGLIDVVVPPAELDATVERYCTWLLKGAPGAHAAVKEIVREVAPMPFKEALPQMARRSAALFASGEAREGMRSFIERRRPAWDPDR